MSYQKPGGDDSGDNQLEKDQSSLLARFESNILAQLGLGTLSTELWHQQVRKIEQIAQEGHKEAIDQIVQYLKLTQEGKPFHEGVRVAAVRALTKLAKQDISLVSPGYFIDALDDEQPHVRAAAIEGLIVYGWRLPDQLFKELTKKLISEDKLVKMVIIHLLVSLLQQPPLQPLWDTHQAVLYYYSPSLYSEIVHALLTALHDRNWQVRKSAVVALGRLKNGLSRDQHEELTARLYDDDALVSSATRFILGEQSSQARLREDLLSPQSTSRSLAALILGEMNDLEPKTLDALRKVAQDLQVDSEVREAALLALAEQRLPINQKAMKRLLNDQDQSVRAAALLLHNVLTSNSGDDEPDDIKPISFEQRQKNRRAKLKDPD